MHVRVKPKRIKVKARTRKRVRVVHVPIAKPFVAKGDQYYRYLDPEEEFEPGDEMFVGWEPIVKEIPSTWMGLKKKNIPSAFVRRRVEGKPTFPRPKNFAGF